MTISSICQEFSTYYNKVYNIVPYDTPNNRTFKWESRNLFFIRFVAFIHTQRPLFCRDIFSYKAVCTIVKASLIHCSFKFIRGRFVRSSSGLIQFCSNVLLMNNFHSLFYYLFIYLFILFYFILFYFIFPCSLGKGDYS